MEGIGYELYEITSSGLTHSLHFLTVPYDIVGNLLEPNTFNVIIYYILTNNIKSFAIKNLLAWIMVF